MSEKETIVKELFDAGVHFGYTKRRRHPSILSFLFGTKNKGNDLIDLEKVADTLIEAESFVASVAASGKQILFVGGKNEARVALKQAAFAIDMPYVNGRWIGGTITNFKEIRKRVDRLESLRSDKEKGVLEEKYTKKERLLLDREMDKLENMFGGIIDMRARPAAVFIVDPKHEEAALKEAVQYNIPVIALANTDCDIANIKYPIPGNDSSKKSIKYISERISKALRKKSATSVADKSE